MHGSCGQGHASEVYSTGVGPKGPILRRFPIINNKIKKTTPHLYSPFHDILISILVSYCNPLDQFDCLIVSFTC